VLFAATCDRLGIMRRAEGTFNLDRFDDEAPYEDREGVQLTRAGTGELSGIRGAGQIIIGPDGGHFCTLDYEL